MQQNDEVFNAGLSTRRKMFGAAGAEQAIEGATEFNAPLQDLVTRYCFGEVWERKPLDHKTRSLLTLAILGTLVRPNQIRAHVRGALANGASKDEIREVLLHVMIYAGVPSAVEAFAAASEALREANLD